MVMLSSCDALSGGELESVTVAVKVKVPALVGVPVIAPSEARVKPGGKGPGVDQVKGGFPSRLG
jgi:hypothetical protein